MPNRVCTKCGHWFYSPTIEVRRGGPEGLGVVCADCRIEDAKSPEDHLFDRCRRIILSNNSLCLGEAHENGGLARRMLVKHMARFAQLGVRWIGLEAPYTFEADINQDPEMGRHILNGLKGKNPGLGDVGYCAARAGLYVACFDCDYGDAVAHKRLLQLLPDEGLLGEAKQTSPKFSTTSGEFQGWINKYRLPVMNYFAAIRINMMDRAHEPHILLVGADHFKNQGPLLAFHKRLSKRPVIIDTTI